MIPTSTELANAGKRLMTTTEAYRVACADFEARRAEMNASILRLAAASSAATAAHAAYSRMCTGWIEEMPPLQLPQVEADAAPTLPAPELPSHLRGIALSRDEEAAVESL